MKVSIKKIIIVIIVCLIFTMGCTNNEAIHIDDISSIIRVNNTISLSKYYNREMVYYTSSNENILYINMYEGSALAEGDVVLSVYSVASDELLKEYLITVKNNYLEELQLSGESKVNVGEEIILSLSVSPTRYEDDIIWESSDESIATVDNGIVTGVSNGFVTIKAMSNVNNNIQDEILIYVDDNESASSIVITEGETNTETIDISTLKQSLMPLIENNSSSIVGLKSYYRYYGRDILAYEASAIVYKRTYILESGEEVTTLEDNQRFSKYKYYLITNKSIVEGMNKVVAFYDSAEHKCSVIAADSKVNIAVITFESVDYFSVTTFGDSDSVQTGELVISIGSSDKTNIYNSASLGIVSYNKRYLSDDTDGDGINDWDALYIQHDASISSNSYGGALVNMKGEVIAINTLRITSSKIDNMSFAIPSNLVLKLVEKLEQGIVPQRYLFNLSFMEVKTIINNGYQNKYVLPEGVTTGLYISTVTSGGVGDKAGLQTGDIILEFADQTIEFSYQIREVLDDLLFSERNEATIKINRNGEIMTLKVVF